MPSRRWLVAVGLDLALDPRVTELNGLGPTAFLSRISAAIVLLPQMLAFKVGNGAAYRQGNEPGGRKALHSFYKAFHQSWKVRLARPRRSRVGLVSLAVRLRITHHHVRSFDPGSWKVRLARPCRNRVVLVSLAVRLRITHQHVRSFDSSARANRLCLSFPAGKVPGAGEARGGGWRGVRLRRRPEEAALRNHEPPHHLRGRLWRGLRGE